MRSLAQLAILAVVLGYPAMARSEPAPRLAFLRPAPQQPDASAAKEEARRARPAAAEESPARRALRQRDFYDPGNPDRHLLQQYGTATAALPKDREGFTDWMRALQENRFVPRSSLHGEGEMEILDRDVVMRNTRDMPWVRFPHRGHTLWLACSNCHPAPFEARAGANRIAMADIFRGRYCGICHDRVAFVTFFSCDRCHSVAQSPAIP